MQTKLHYIYDPLCGWCYAAESLLETAIASGNGLYELELHAGGLFQRMHIPAIKRDMIRQSDARISQMTGQIFGDAYLKGLLDNPQTIFDSLPTIAAILAAEKLQKNHAPFMLKAIQHAHYRDGKHIVQPDVLADIAEAIGLDRHEFAMSYEEVLSGPVQSHIDDTLRLMHHAGANGFPAFVLQKGDRLEKLEHTSCYGQPEAFRDFLLGKLDKPAT